jgi:glucose/arabinose dehydrogenase
MHPARLLLGLSQLTLLTALTSSCSDNGGGDIQEPGAVADVTVTAPATTLQIGRTVQLTATARDKSGAAVEGATFEWTTSNPDVALVTGAGLVTGVAAGQVEIRAATDGVTGRLALTVTATPPPSTGTPTLQPVAGGLEFPVYLTSPPGDQRLFVVEKGGAIRVIKDGSLLPAPFLDIGSQVSNRREQGLLGLAFAPDYASSGRFFIHYTDRAGDTRVSMLRVSTDPDRADPASETAVLSVDQPGPSHNGGQILFGPDGFLYIALGDGGSRDGNDRGRGQSLADLLGSILRIDVSAGAAYSVPPDNPFVGTAGARPEVWSYGLRNPWRFTFDPATGDLYIADVGETDWEEINRSTAAEGAGRGLNYGWSRMEGRHCLGNNSCDQSGLTLPILEYSHSEGCSITGGYVYRGAALPALQGQYFFADFCQGWVRSLRMDGSTPVTTDWPALSPGNLVTSFGEDNAGELYVLSGGGTVYKIVPGA